MKTLFTLLLACSFIWCNAQKLSYADFQKEARINKRLLPKYGNLTKSDDERVADKAFIEKAKEEHQTVAKASRAMVMSGYKKLESDPKEAMVCFNKAYLLDSTNADIYWGYGQLYYHFEQYDLAKNYYLEGLSINPKSTLILNSMGKNCIEMYHKDGDEEHLHGGIESLQSSFMIDPSNSETSRVLTSVFLELKDCEKAKKYFHVYQATEKEKEDTEMIKKMKDHCQLN